MSLGAARRNCFPSVLLHPPPLASAFVASYGEMSRRSGEAAKVDNHSDISPCLLNQSFAGEWLSPEPELCQKIVSDLLMCRDHLRPRRSLAHVALDGALPVYKALRGERDPMASAQRASTAALDPRAMREELVLSTPIRK